MTDERPRPQYGEYATAEEQVNAGGVSGATSGGTTGSEPNAQSGLTPTVFSSLGSTRNSAPEATRGAAAGPSAGAPGVPHPWDLSLTIFLLTLNAYLVLTSIPDWVNLSATLTTGYRELGYGDYTSTELANAIGSGIVAVQGVLLVAVLYLAITRLRAQRRASPIVFGLGLVAVVLTVVLLMVAMTTDPALADYIATQRGS